MTHARSDLYTLSASVQIRHSIKLHNNFHFVTSEQLSEPRSLVAPSASAVAVSSTSAGERQG